MRRSVTPETFHVLGVGAEVGRPSLVNPDDADAAHDVEAALPRGTLADVLLQRLPHDLRRANALSLASASSSFLSRPSTLTLMRSMGIPRIV